MVRGKVFLDLRQFCLMRCMGGNEIEKALSGLNLPSSECISQSAASTGDQRSMASNQIKCECAVVDVVAAMHIMRICGNCSVVQCVWFVVSN